MEKIQNPLWNPRRLLQIQFQRLEPDTMKQEKQLYPDECRQLHDHLQELNVNPHDSVSIITPPFRFHYSMPDGSGQQKKAGEGVEGMLFGIEYDPETKTVKIFPLNDEGSIILQEKDEVERFTDRLKNLFR